MSRLNSNGNTFIPPDTMGAVGPRHVVQLINGEFVVFDKTTGAQVERRSLDSFWTTRAGLAIVNNGRFDPRIVYDPVSERWFALSIDGIIDADNDNVNEAANNFFVARTDTDDPTGDWDGVTFNADSQGALEFHDYPTLGLDANFLYSCTQDFDGGGNESCYSIPKADLLAAVPTAANLVRFEATPAGLPTVSGSIQPAVDHGGVYLGRGVLLGAAGGSLVRSNIFPDGTLDAPTGIAGAPGHAVPPAARQPDDTDNGDGIETIENVAPRFVGNVIVVGGSLWAVHAVAGSGTNSALRWYEIEEATDTVLQTGLIEDAARDFHEPSIAVNGLGQAVIGYTCSGPNLPASVCVSVGETAAGVTTFEAPAIAFTGTGTYYRDYCTAPGCTNERNRWGDYSATVVDPSDSCTFWTFQQYTAQGAAGDVGPGEAEAGNWGTRAVELTFNDCIGGDLRVTKECKPDDPLLAGQTGTCTILVDNLGPGSALDVVLTDEHVSNGTFTFGTVETTAGTCTVTPNPQVNEGTVTCELGRLSPGDRVTIKVPVSATAPQNVNDIATVSSSSEDPDLSNNQDEDGLTVVAAADLQLTKTDAPDPVVAGTNLTYTLTARNNGPSSAAGVVVEDFLPSGVSIVSVSTPDGACVAGVPGSALQPTTCNLGTLAPSAQEVVTIVVQVLPQTVGSLQNGARVSSSTADPDNSNDLATSTTAVTSQSDLSLVKADSPDPVSAGAELPRPDRLERRPLDRDRHLAHRHAPGRGRLPRSSRVRGRRNLLAPGRRAHRRHVQPRQPGPRRCGRGHPHGEGQGVRAERNRHQPGRDRVVHVGRSEPRQQRRERLDHGRRRGGHLARQDRRRDHGESSRTVRFNLTVYNKPGCEADDQLSCGLGGPSDAQNITVVDTLPLTPKKVKVVSCRRTAPTARPPTR